MVKSQYSQLERKIAYLLTYLPFIKRIIKSFVQFVNLFFFRKNYKYKSISEINFIYPVNRDKSETFFGYYDKSPLNLDNNYIIYHLSNLSTARNPNKVKNIEIYLFDILNNKHFFISETSAFNWQIGSRLQWISNSRFIFNDFSTKKKRYISKIYNVKEKIFEKVFEVPIYDCFEDKFAITLNFLNLNNHEKDYAYNAHLKESDFLESTNSISLINLLNGNTKEIIQLKQILELKYLNSMKNAHHIFNHIMISPDGSKFLFIHRWFKRGVRFDRLLLSDINGKNVKIIADEKMVSHYCWINEKQLIGYLRFKGKNGFYVFDLEKNYFEETYFNHLNINNGDGHPSFKNDKIIFDIYPDKSRMSKIFMFKKNENDLIILGEFFNPLKYKGINRCDLHPRFSKDGRKIFFDCVHTGKRKLAYINCE